MLSGSHQRVRRLRQLVRKRAQRAAEQVVVVEGAELLGVALDAGRPVESVYLAPGAVDHPGVAEVVARGHHAGARVFELAPGVLERVASTVSPQPVLAVVGHRPPQLAAALDGATLVVVCLDVRDPGNLGTVIRTADAAGADAVVCCGGTVDPGNPKAVRASAGSLFHLPVVAEPDLGLVLAGLAARRIRTVATVVRSGTEYTSYPWTGPVALVLGNEAAGLPPEVVDRLDDRVTITMAGRAESLNVSLAAGIVCFEALRQRRAATPGTRADVPGATGTGSTMQDMVASVHPDGAPSDIDDAVDGADGRPA